MSDKNIHGTCGACGGPVITYRFWGGSMPQVPACESCGRRVKSPYGMTLPMEDNPVRTITTTTIRVGDCVKKQEAGEDDD